jgi:beta-glucanase (GH16 family)
MYTSRPHLRAPLSAFALCCLMCILPGCAGSNGDGFSAPATGRSSFAERTAPKMLLDDEFDKSSLDTKIWYRCYSWAQASKGCTNGGNLELEWYRSSHVTLAAGNLNLTATAQPQHGHPYTSGMVSTGGDPNGSSTFSYKYGYAEIRAKLPHGPGMWPAFWIVPSNRTWPPEIDFMEYQGIQPRIDYVTTHWGKDNHQSSTAVDTGVDLSQGYHTYGCDWEPDRITWYFDGRVIKTFTERAGIPHQPMYVLLNLAIGGWVKGQLQPNPSDFPATFSIEYVRIWARKP